MKRVLAVLCALLIPWMMEAPLYAGGCGVGGAGFVCQPAGTAKKFIPDAYSRVRE